MFENVSDMELAFAYRTAIEISAGYEGNQPLTARGIVGALQREVTRRITRDPSIFTRVQNVPSK
jgi:hypothetical protein